MSVNVRQATIGDLDRVAPLFDDYRQFYGQVSDIGLARRFLSERFAHHQSVVFLAQDEHGRGVGFTQLYPSFSSVSAAPIYILNDLFVAATARHRGVATSLLTAAADFGREAGAARLTLSTALTNEAAQTLYESLGWKRDEEFCDYNLSL